MKKLTKKQTQIIDRLFELSKQKDKVSGASIVACLTYKNFLFFGENQMKTCPFQCEFAKNSEAQFIHAEVDVIKQARKFLTEKEFKRATLIVVRAKQDPESKDYVFGCSKPCCGCERCINEYSIKNVIYYNQSETGFVKEELLC